MGAATSVAASSLLPYQQDSKGRRFLRIDSSRRLSDPRRHSVAPQCRSVHSMSARNQPRTSQKNGISDLAFRGLCGYLCGGEIPNQNMMLVDHLSSLQRFARTVTRADGALDIGFRGSDIAHTWKTIGHGSSGPTAIRDIFRFDCDSTPIARSRVPSNGIGASDGRRSRVSTTILTLISSSRRCSSRRGRGHRKRAVRPVYRTPTSLSDPSCWVRSR